jgi:hypothetical protein
MSCQVIRDKRTRDTLQYAFIGFDKREDTEQVREPIQLGLLNLINALAYEQGLLQNVKRSRGRSLYMG